MKTVFRFFIPSALSNGNIPPASTLRKVLRVRERHDDSAELRARTGVERDALAVRLPQQGLVRPPPGPQA